MKILFFFTRELGEISKETENFLIIWSSRSSLPSDVVPASRLTASSPPPAPDCPIL